MGKNTLRLIALLTVIFVTALVWLAANSGGPSDADTRLYWKKYAEETDVLNAQTALIERRTSLRHQQTEITVARANAGMIDSPDFTPLSDASAALDRDEAELKRRYNDLHSWLSDFEAKYPRSKYQRYYEQK